jgi:ribosomal protein S15P/S13E
MYMSEELAEAMHFLSADGYVVRTPQAYFVFTNKFYNEFTGHDIGLVPDSRPIIMKSETTSVLVPPKQLTKTTISEAYLAFILRCNVPRRIVNPKGDSYAANQFSEKGAKAFGKILVRVHSGEIDIDLLIHTVQLYYKSSQAYKLKIGNYIGDGAWETDYQELVNRLSKGTINEHIKQETKDDNTGRSRYQLEGKRDGSKLLSPSKKG